MHRDSDSSRTAGGGIEVRAPLAVVVLLACLALAGCETVPGRQHAGPVKLLSASAEIPEQQLLDVGIEVFDPGHLPAAGEDKTLGIAPEIRGAEARFIPVHLKQTMQKTGRWGAVRVVPTGTAGMEVLVHGQIQQSDGEVLELRIDADDATGRQWFSKFYHTEIPPGGYSGSEVGVQDPFQDIYNTIANDLAMFRANLGQQEVANIRRVAELRFATDFAPDAFAAYLARGPDGTYQLQRLPAREDPMLDRVRKIRERDQLLIDTLNGHFDNYYREMWDSYVQWRKDRSEEAAALREVKREALNRELLGAAAIVGAIALQVFGSDNVSRNTGTLSTVMVAGGALAVKSGLDKAGEAQIHEDSLRELGDSFKAEVKPLVVQVEGKSVELTGSAEAQYRNWRALLRKIYSAETGFAPPAGTEVTVQQD